MEPSLTGAIVVGVCSVAAQGVLSIASIVQNKKYNDLRFSTVEEAVKGLKEDVKKHNNFNDRLIEVELNQDFDKQVIEEIKISRKECKANCPATKGGLVHGG